MADVRETHWRERFSKSAASADSENEANIYTAHGWQRRRDVFDSVVDHLLESGHLSRDMRVLDIGCGTGAYSRSLMNRGIRNVVGADLCIEMVKYASERAGGHGHWVQANSLAVPFGNDCFDLVVSIGMIQHLTDIGPFFAECGRILRPGGTLMVMTLNRRTVLQAIRACRLSHRRIDVTGDAVLRRYVPQELQESMAPYLKVAKSEETSVVVLPKGLRWAEISPAPDSLLGAVCMPWSVSFILTVHTSAP